MWKVEAILPVPVAFVAEQCINCDLRLKWDPSCATYQVIEHVSENVDITYYQNKEALGGAISPRDFIDIRNIERQMKPKEGAEEEEIERVFAIGGGFPQQKGTTKDETIKPKVAGMDNFH